MADMWKIHEEDPNAWAVITTNTTVRRDHAGHHVNVMGGGLALDAANRNPLLPQWYADRIIEGNIAVAYTQDRLLLVPTKRDVRKDSTFELVRIGCNWISAWAQYNPGQVALVPKLGCGLGGLDINDVEPYLAFLHQSNPEQVVLV